MHVLDVAPKERRRALARIRATSERASANVPCPECSDVPSPSLLCCAAHAGSDQPAPKRHPAPAKRSPPTTATVPWGSYYVEGIAHHQPEPSEARRGNA